MFAKLSALLLALPLVSALTILPLTGATPGATVTIQWTASTTDPSYISIELENPAFNNQYAIASNVQTSLGEVTITLPQVNPGGDYNLVVIQVNNINQVLATSSTFSINAATTSSTASASTTSSASSSSGSLGTSSTASPTSTSPVSSVSSAVVTGTSASTSSAASSTPSSFTSNGAAAFKVPGMVPAAGVLLSAVAGAAMVF